MTKRLRIFAGPNGSGKSSLYAEIKKEYNSGSFINADLLFQLLQEKNQFDFSLLGITEAAKFLQESNYFESILTQSILYSKIKELRTEKSILYLDGLDADNQFASALSQFIFLELLDLGFSFSYETVMSDPRKIDLFKLAKSKGYKLYLYFICTESPQINIGRIDQRVASSGHDVPDERVIKRYNRVFEHLKDVVNIMDRAYFFDNSGMKPDLFCEVNQGDYQIIKDQIPNWFIQRVVRKSN